MGHESPLIALLVGGLVLAFVLGALAHRLRLSPLVGYLLAGMVVGPLTPGFVGNSAMASQLAEIGVVLLMFGVGLHFSIDDLKDVGLIAVPWAVVLLRALEEHRMIETSRGKTAIGWLIVEDLAMILALVLLPVLAPASCSRCPSWQSRWAWPSVPRPCSASRSRLAPSSRAGRTASRRCVTCSNRAPMPRCLPNGNSPIRWPKW